MRSYYIIYPEDLDILTQLASNIQFKPSKHTRDYKIIAEFQAKQAKVISRLLDYIRSNQKSESAGDYKPESQHCRVAESQDQPRGSRRDQPAKIRPDQLKGD